MEGRSRVTLLDGATAARVANLLDRLAAAGHTVAVAESLTGGLLCSTLVHPAGASRVIRGGVVAYASDVKTSTLGVPAELLDRLGAVNAEVAVAMAEGVHDRLGATIGVATTGVAGPDPQDGVLPGTAFIAVAFDGVRTPVVEKVDISGDRDDIRFGVVLVALALLENSLRAE